MAVTYGFFNSLNGDRRYDALQLSRIFDGIIEDGVYQNIGDALMVRAGTGMNVIVGVGRAWFNHTWTLNDAPLPLSIEPSELVASRIDAVVLDVNADILTRKNDIIIVKGDPTTQIPQRPILIKDENHWQYALSYITIPAMSTEISQSNMVNVVGMSETPFVTGPLKTMSINGMVAQWETQFYEWFSQLETDLEGNPITNLQVQINRLNSLRFATLSTQGWTTTAPYTQIIPLPGFKDKDSPFIQCINDPTDQLNKNQIQKQWNFIDSIEITRDTLTATCKFARPTVDLQIAIKGR